MTPADVLEAAADALFVHGRARGSGRLSNGSMCVVGAIVFVQGKDPSTTVFRSHEDPARAALERWLCATGHGETIPGSCRRAAWSWNDTTMDDDEVLDTLKRCAKALREVES